MRFALAALSVICAAAPAQAVVIGGPLIRDGVVIVPSYTTGVTMDRMAVPGGSIHLEAAIHAGKDEPHGFAEHDWIPYLGVSYALTRDDTPTFRKSGLLYPVAAKDGPRYGGDAELAGPGVYHLTYIVAPPTAHGMLRHTDKASGVPAWWKPITGNWTFTYPGQP